MGSRPVPIMPKPETAPTVAANPSFVEYSPPLLSSPSFSPKDMPIASSINDIRSNSISSMTSTTSSTPDLTQQSPSNAESLLSSPSSIVLDPLLLPPPALDSYSKSSYSSEGVYTCSRRESQNGNVQLSPASVFPPPPDLKRTIIQVTPEPSHSNNHHHHHNTRKRKQPPAASSAVSPKAKRVHIKLKPKAAATSNSPAVITTSTTSHEDKAQQERKHARKTAHSEIERRRRSKMNQEFEALKQLVPACHQHITSSDQKAKNNGSNGSSNNAPGLHKLVILQATVEYVKYLKACLESVEKSHFNGDHQLHHEVVVDGAQDQQDQQQQLQKQQQQLPRVFPPSPSIQEPSPRIRVSDLIS